MELTIEEQEKLTEFLGECWHSNFINRGGSYLPYDCGKCGLAVHDINYNPYDYPNFDDLNIVSRLIAKVGSIKLYLDVYTSIWWASVEGHCQCSGKSLQSAICRAILSYMEK